jgi:hypothetical protein
MNKGDFSMRIWLLLGAVVAVVTTTKVFGLVGDSDVMSSAYEERFNSWYVEAEVMNSDDVIVEYESDFARLEEQLTEMSAVAEQRDTLPTHEWVITKNSKPKKQRVAESRLRLANASSVIPVEVYDADTTMQQFNTFIDKLIWGHEVRIAFMGDSFIEGDILTSDLREKLQSTFGGRGVGFVQCDIPFATARRTIKRTASGWDAYSVLKPKNNPSTINDEFFVSGYTARGGSGAKVSWQTTTAFERLDSCSRARILLTTPDSVATVRVTINRDTTLKREFEILGLGMPQQILIEGGVERLDMEVVSGRVDCYGASIEGVGGVVVDNLSMRANSGHAIFGTSAVTNRVIDAYLDYDLVVLQYGLNIMEAGKSNYSAYRNKLNEMVAYAKSCFPNAAVLILGVSDRWIKSEESGGYVAMSSVGAMTKYQREAAQQSAVSFWPTAEAMVIYGGMPGFVSNGWAAKDYTHINFAGGQRVGEELHKAIVKYAYDRLKSGKSTSPATTYSIAQPIKVHKPNLGGEVTPLVQQESATHAPEPSETVSVDMSQDEVSASVADNATVEDVNMEEIAEVVETSEMVVEDVVEESASDMPVEEVMPSEVVEVPVEVPSEELPSTTESTLTIDEDEEDFFETTI